MSGHGTAAGQGPVRGHTVQWRPERLNMLTDGVYAIVMTLLVLELRLPEGMSPSTALAHLDAFGPKLMAYVIGFTVAGSAWAYVHHINSLYGRSNLLHVSLNLIALMFISLVPFCASVMGKFPFTAYGPAAYGIVVGLGSATYTLDLILTQRELISPAIERRLVRQIILGTSIGSAWALFVGLVLAPWNPMLALAALVVHFAHHWIWLAVTERRVHAASVLADVWDPPHEAPERPSRRVRAGVR